MFYLVCRQNRSITLTLHCSICCMEHLDHENLSLCVLSTFSTYHGRTCLLSFLLSECFFARITYLQLCMTLPRARMTKQIPESMFFSGIFTTYFYMRMTLMTVPGTDQVDPSINVLQRYIHHLFSIAYDTHDCHSRD